MAPDQQLFDHLHRGKVLRAREFSPHDRWLACMEQSEHVANAIKDGIRAQFPGAGEDDVLRIARERLNRLRRAGRRCEAP